MGRIYEERGARSSMCISNAFTNTNVSCSIFFGAPRKIAASRRTPQNCLRLIPLCSRSNSWTFTLGLSAIGGESNFSRCPSSYFVLRGAGRACSVSAPLAVKRRTTPILQRDNPLDRREVTLSERVALLAKKTSSDAMPSRFVKNHSMLIVKRAILT